jgi:hypothetical protein
VFADNVIPSILIHLGIIDLSTASPTSASLFPGAGAEPALSSLFAAAPEPEPSPAAVPSVPIAIVDGPVLTPAQSYVLRAAAIEACERIVARAHAMTSEDPGPRRAGAPPWLKDITLPALDNWLWTIAKDRADYRVLPRFALRNTPFF